MSRLTCAVSLALLSLPACTTSAGSTAEPSDPEVTLAAQDALAAPGDAWEVAPTLHVGERAFGQAATGGRRVYPVWLAGSVTTPVTLDVTATAMDGDDVRIAVLGPLRGGSRAVLGAGGYAQPRGNVELTVDATTSGEHLIVVGSFDLARDTMFHVGTHCWDCVPGATDILAVPKDGALVATGDRIIHAQLGDVLATRTFDVELELWASPPAHPWAATKVATAVASGGQLNVIVPASVHAGDDLRLVITDGAGTTLDAGVATRFMPTATALVRTDARIYGDTGMVQASGIVGLFEGRAPMSMRSETHHVVIADTTVVAERPGQVGNGFASFDATFAPELADEHGTLNPALPRNGDLLSIGSIDGNGGYRRLGCFEYCNDLSGMATCTGGARTCPAASW
ncbi:hypothetical protein BH11MYX3_BH11MYX3_37790 [soil metagenome]